MCLLVLLAGSVGAEGADLLVGGIEVVFAGGVEERFVLILERWVLPSLLILQEERKGVSAGWLLIASSISGYIGFPLLPYMHCIRDAILDTFGIMLGSQDDAHTISIRISPFAQLT